MGAVSGVPGNTHRLNAPPATASGALSYAHNRKARPVSDFPRPFVLRRAVDHTGVSGTGTVAEGALFTDGTAVIRWRGRHASTVVWASLDDALAVHGHNGDTRAVFAHDHQADSAA